MTHKTTKRVSATQKKCGALYVELSEGPSITKTVIHNICEPLFLYRVDCQHFRLKVRRTLLADGCDAWELLAFEVLEHCTTTCRYVAYLVCEAHLSYSCN